MSEKYLYPASLKTKNGTMWGYINEQGEFEIQPIFDYALDFQKNKLATVEKDGKYGCIDLNGNIVIPLIFESTINFNEERASVVYDGGFQVIDESGKFLTTKSFNFIGMYQDGRALVSDQDNEGTFKYGFLNRSGDLVIPLKYATASDFKDRSAIVKTNENRFALIDRNGNELFVYHYYFVGSLGDHLLTFQKEAGGKYGYIDLPGNIVIPPKYSMALAFENRRAIVNVATDIENKYGLIDRTGTYVIKPMYNDLNLLGENRVAVGKSLDKEKPYLGSSYALSNWKGDILTDFVFEHVSQFDQGVASVTVNNKAFFIDRSGKKARGLPTVVGADSVTLIGNLVRALKNTRVAYFTRKGTLVWRQNTVIPLTNRYRILEKRYEPNKNFVVLYPQIEGLKSEKAENTVNKKLKELSNLKEIKPTEQLDYTYTGDFNVQFFKKNLLVLELNGYEYYFGAAHGMPTKIHPNINLINGRFYKLEDLFLKDSHYIERLNTIIETMIKTDPQYDYVFPGAFKGISVDQLFYVDEKNLYIYFPPYEIGPYAAGFITFKISFTSIMNIIDTKGEFWVSFH